MDGGGFDSFLWVGMTGLSCMYSMCASRDYTIFIVVVQILTRILNIKLVFVWTGTRTNERKKDPKHNIRTTLETTSPSYPR